MDCLCNAKATVKVANPQQVADDLKAMLAKNPLLSEKDIFEHYQDELSALLDSDFNDYCTSDDYYEPVERTTLAITKMWSRSSARSTEWN